MAYVVYEGLEKYDARRRAEAEKLYQKALLDAHPVKSWYESDDSTSPAELFGGTWEQDTSGRVLISACDAYTVKSEGGKSNTTIQLKNLPGLAVIANSNSNASSIVLNSTAIQNGATVASGDWRFSAVQDWYAKGVGDGRDVPINNMQPYRATYRWQRIA